ncbi:hypothetical protein GQS52_03340 [Streptomyces sp. SCUT-3]|uniref:nSTAND3 domain-containing NTPase n=1 Tax=Streptomyces TaxID=1883 RepID=UPI0015FE0E51|nr:hypothetical protein [Streptomyces sp. SCUT-3]QMV20974.1 hypothetical protein GQS52_03340 [Streptomyces sp. SCUT-3]
MSDTLNSQILGAQGPVHGGNGDQYNYNYTYASDSRVKNPRSIAEDQLLWLWRRFVPPEGFGEARRTLESHGTALLDGPPGSGRTSAARVLLHELRREAGSFHELLPDEEDVSLRDPGLVGDGDRLLLDLSDADEALWVGVRQDLSSLRRNALERGARLVVVLPRRGSRTLPEDLNQYRVQVVRPQERDVLLRHLRMDGVPLDDDTRTLPVLSRFLRSEPPMREVAGLADLIRRARDAARAGEGFADWCGRALAALDDQGPQVAKKVAGLGKGPQRALLLSAAMLHGAHPDVVHCGAASLLTEVDHPESDRPLLEHPDLAARLEEISAGPDANGLVRFDELDHDTAVRAHFWDHMPDLREPLCAWVGRLVDLEIPKFTQGDRDRLAERLAEQYLRTGHPGGLASFVERWAAPGAAPRCLRAAARALRCGLLDERHGRFLRGKVYDWAKNGRLGEGLASVLVGVCTEVVAVRHPDQAVVRLHHLARRERQGPRARDALLGLVEEDHRLRRFLLHRLALALPGGAWATDLDLFLQAADPRVLTDPGARVRALLEEAPVRDWLATGWGAVLRRCPRRTWEPHAQRWLHTACTAGDHDGLLLDVLVAAAAPQGDLFAALYATARSGQRSAPGGPERGAAVTDRLLAKISAAQGLRPAPPPPPRAPHHSQQSFRGTYP